MGFYPAFAWTGRGFLLSSHQDIAAEVLEQAGHPCDFDPVTMAEFLRTGTATHPHTYWHGISQLDAGTHYCSGNRGTADLTKVKSYWRPAYFDGRYLSDRQEIVDRLTQALGNAVRRRTQPRLGKVAVLLSSGADSRTALFGAQNPSDVVAFTMFDEPNAELDGARRLAAAAGAKHVEFKRAQDYYIKHAAEAVRISGGMWTIESAHYGGLLPELNAAKPGVVLTGCYADYLLKGITYDTRPKTLFGRALPLNRLTSFDYEWHHPHVELSSLWQERVKQRLASYFFDFTSGENLSPSLIEYRRLAPVIREPDASGRLFLKRTSPTDLFMADNDVLELFGSISPKEKINAIPFGMAVDRICGMKARHILNNNYGAPVGVSEFRRVTSFLKGSLRRKITRQGTGQPYDSDPRSVATAGSWPYFPRVIEFSAELRQWLANISKEQDEMLFDIVGTERRAWTIEDWARRAPTLFMRLFTASLWLSQNPAAATRRRLND
jgi:asparagine synthase (glutamine-hydrolysing)